MKKHIDDARRQLTDLETLASQTERMERRILESAKKRLAVVEAELQHITPSAAITGVSSSAKYMELLEEKAILNQVIARTRSELHH
jgi:hypothetical protein